VPDLETKYSDKIRKLIVDIQLNKPDFFSLRKQNATTIISRPEHPVAKIGELMRTRVHNPSTALGDKRRIRAAMIELHRFDLSRIC